MIDKNILGFSCVENHVLDYLKNKCYDIRLLYYDCFVSLQSLYSYSSSNSYEYFCEIPRIQDLLAEEKVLTIGLYKYDFYDFLNVIKDNNNLILMRLNSENTQKLFCARGLREDHYVKIEKCEEEYILTNDIPYKSIHVDGETLLGLYENDFLLIACDNYIGKDKLRELSTKKRCQIVLANELLADSCVSDDNFPIVFRNTLVLLKKIRERLNLFMQANGYDFEIECEINNIAKIITKIEYLRIKNLFNHDELLNLVTQVNDIESVIWNKVKVIYERVYEYDRKD